MSQDGSTESHNDATLGRIPLKQVRVKRGTNPVNHLVPYLDLFWRLDDAELGRLAGVEAEVVAGLRKQVFEVDRALERYVDLLPRLSDDELVRLTGATEKTIRFWRLCQPRTPSRDRKVEAVPAAASRPDTRRPETDSPVAASEPAETETKRKKRQTRTPGETTASPLESQPATDARSNERRDAKVTINPAAQATVDAMMTFSGAPFPGYDDGESQGRPPPDEISLADVETP
jgi:hypothetical protein